MLVYLYIVQQFCYNLLLIFHNQIDNFFLKFSYGEIEFLFYQILIIILYYLNFLLFPEFVKPVRIPRLFPLPTHLWKESGQVNLTATSG